MMEIKPKQFKVNGTERPINVRRKTILDRYFILGSLIICNRTLKSQSQADIHCKTPAATEDYKTKKINTSKTARHERTAGADPGFF